MKYSRQRPATRRRLEDLPQQLPRLRRSQLRYSRRRSQLQYPRCRSQLRQPGATRRRARPRSRADDTVDRSADQVQDLRADQVQVQGASNARPRNARMKMSIGDQPGDQPRCSRRADQPGEASTPSRAHARNARRDNRHRSIPPDNGSHARTRHPDGKVPQIARAALQPDTWGMGTTPQPPATNHVTSETSSNPKPPSPQVAKGRGLASYAQGGGRGVGYGCMGVWRGQGAMDRSRRVGLGDRQCWSQDPGGDDLEGVTSGGVHGHLSTRPHPLGYVEELVKRTRPLPFRSMARTSARRSISWISNLARYPHD